MLDTEPGIAVLISDAARERLKAAVVLADTEEGLSVIPVSAEVGMASEWDLLLDASVFGYAALAQIWNYGTVLPEQVRERVAEVPTEVSDALRTLSRAARRGEPTPDGVPVGPPVLDDADPRLLFQDAEGEAMRVFWAPALELAGALTVGELVRHRRAELGLAIDELAEIPAAWLDDLEHDRLYLPWALAPAKLATLMRRLRFGASRRLGRITRATVEVVQPALPRGARDPILHETVEPDQYVAAFLRELAGEADDE